MPETSTNSQPARNYPHASESEEREIAIRRGLMRRRALDAGEKLPPARSQAVAAANPAFAALAENVRDYAVFLMNPDGVIEYWGEGAHLIKWWTDDEAEGAHLRMLYLEGGSEDGTAEEHLRQSAETGEYVGEGQRVRSDGTTFWAHVTLTALRSREGTLLGFAKVTRDMTARRATEAAVALANAAQIARDQAVAMAEEAQKAQARAEEAEAFAREHARGAQEYIKKLLEPQLTALSKMAETAAEFERDIKEGAEQSSKDVISRVEDA